MQISRRFERTGKTASFTALTVAPGGASFGGAADFGGGSAAPKSLLQIQQECLGTGGPADYANAVVMITGLRESQPLVYQACPSEGCSKKLLEEGPGMFRCERCSASLSSCDHRFSFSMQLSDESASQYVSVFNEAGLRLFAPHSPAEIYALQSANDPAFHEILAGIRSPATRYSVRLRAKQETFGGETRVKYHCMSIAPVDVHAENEHLLNDVESALQQAF